MPELTPPPTSIAFSKPDTPYTLEAPDSQIPPKTLSLPVIIAVIIAAVFAAIVAPSLRASTIKSPGLSAKSLHTATKSSTAPIMATTKYTAAEERQWNSLVYW
jgi:hypothetical protein